MKKSLLAILLALPFLVSSEAMPKSGESNAPAAVAASTQTRSIYYWKTTFRLGEEEQSFLKKHDIDRIYLRMFDVGAEPDYTRDYVETNPVASVTFESPKPEGVEIVPTVFITLNALKHFENREGELAAKIVKRVLNMCSYNDLGPISEVQFDCDWTNSTRQMFDRLCGSAMKILHEKGILLSGTIRLHQVEQAEYPFDKGVLMLYNTGAIKDPDTSNSILAYDDVRKYLGVKSRVDRFVAARKTNCRTIDCAYPTFSWNVAFYPDGKFACILRDSNLDTNPILTKKGGRYVVNRWGEVGGQYLDAGQVIRPEFPVFSEICRVKELVGSTVGKGASNIIYHLDCQNLSNYSDNEIDEILR